MASGRNLTVYLTSDVSKFGRGLKQAESRLDKFKKVAVGAMAGAAAAAGYAAIQFGTDGVKAFLDDEAAAKKLAKTLKNLGRAQDTAAVEDYIDAMSRATGVADDDLRPAMEKLLLATKSTEEAQRLLALAMDVAAGSGKPLETVTAAIAKAANGQYGALQRLAPQLDVAAAKAGGLEEVQRQLNKAYGGQAAERAGTYAGQIQSVATAFSELQESFGRGLVGGLEDSNSAMSDLDDTLYELGPAAEELGKTFQDIAVALSETLTYLGPVVQKFNELNDMGDGILTNGTLANVMKGVAGVRYLAGTATGNDAAAAEAWSDYNGGNVQNGGDFAVANPYSQYRPMRYNARAGDAKGRGDGRAAQKGARTRQRP